MPQAVAAAQAAGTQLRSAVGAGPAQALAGAGVDAPAATSVQPTARVWVPPPPAPPASLPASACRIWRGLNTRQALHLSALPGRAVGPAARVHCNAPARGAPAQLPEQAPQAPRLHTCSVHAPVLQGAATGAGGGCEAHAAAASAPAAGAPAPVPRPAADPGPAAAHSAVRTAVPPPQGALHCCQGLKCHTVLVHSNALRGAQSQLRPRWYWCWGLPCAALYAWSSVGPV